MLIRVSRHTSEVAFAKIVMPRSRSRSLESSARSITRWFSRNEPDCWSSRSTRVVLPWSTWAIMAMLRSSIAELNSEFGNVAGPEGPAIRMRYISIKCGEAIAPSEREKRLRRGGLARWFGRGTGLRRSGAVEDRGAPSRDHKAKLVEREGKRHPHRFLELLALALMDDCDDKIVCFHLQLLEFFQALRRVRFA